VPSQVQVSAFFQDPVGWYWDLRCAESPSCADELVVPPIQPDESCGVHLIRPYSKGRIWQAN
jgi:hypothetical protein